MDRRRRDRRAGDRGCDDTVGCESALSASSTTNL